MPGSLLEGISLNAIMTYAPIGISVLALIISGMSLRISFRKDNREILAERPTATAEITGSDLRGWHVVAVKVINRSSVGQRWTNIEVRRPRNARLIANDESLYIKEARTRRLIDPLPFERAGRKVPLDVRLEEFGTEAPAFNGIRMGEGDTCHRSFLLFVPPSMRPINLSIRVSLRSMEPVERSTFIDVRRTATDVTSTARDKTSGTH